jgi:putative tryptophan/tyrosine transport system substrate-binding protein
MRRREFVQLAAAGATIMWPPAAQAQQQAMPVIGYLGADQPPDLSPELLAAPLRGLSEAGYVEGQNVAIEYRWAEDHNDRLPSLAADLVSRKVDVIIAAPFPAAVAAKNATSTIPIVFLSGVDPVAAGLIASLARPGSNLTGVAFLTVELLPKQLELISELVPQARVIALLVNPTNPNAERMATLARESARVKGMQLFILNAGTESQIDAAFASLVEHHAGALVVGGDAFLYGRREQIAALALHHAVPSIGVARALAASGGLMSYGTNFTAMYHQLGVYAGKILKGEKPADLPIQQPTKYELVINLKTATALGLTVPPILLANADEVIE